MKNWKKTVAVICAALACSTVLWGCSGEKKATAPKKVEKQVIVDIKGNRVEVKKDLQKLAVVPLPWASVVYALDGSSKRMVAIHPGAMSAYKGGFLEAQDKHFGTLDTKIINQNFSVNLESMAQAGVEACLMWRYQDKDAEKLQKIGVAAVLIYNDTVENLKKSFLIVGKMLGKEEKAKALNAYYDESYASIKAHKEEIAKAKKPTVLFIRNSRLRLQGNDNFMHEALEIGGAYNPIEQSALDKSTKEITMEEVYKINPDIIFLSNFDKFVPDDLYNNKLPGQDWSTVKAVKNHRVYKVPMGIYRWDAPGVETPLMMRWLAHMLQPEIFKEVDIRKETRTYYKKFLGIDVTDAELSKIFADEANKNSIKVK